MRSEIKSLVDSLLALHKALLDSERSRYESKNGPIKDNNEYFNLVISHEDFKWLRFLSGIIALLDEEAEQDELNREKVLAGLSGLQKALADDSHEEFSAKYRDVLAGNADIAHLDGIMREKVAVLLTK